MFSLGLTLLFHLWLSLGVTFELLGQENLAKGSNKNTSDVFEAFIGMQNTHKTIFLYFYFRQKTYRSILGNWAAEFIAQNISWSCVQQKEKQLLKKICY